MNKSTTYLISTLLISSFLLSCNKYLDEKSNKNLVVLKTLTDLQGLLDNNDFMNTNTPGFGETSSDDYFLTLSEYNSRNEQAKLAYTWRLEEYEFQNDWSDGYRAIYPANYCLDNIDNITRNIQNQVQWENVKGSALFYRAYRFLNLVWEYGKAYDDATSQNDLGIVLRLSSDPTIKSARSNVKECYERVIKDARDAANYLPNNPQHVMRPSKAAAYGLLARAYLSMRKYDSALKYSNLSLQIKKDLIDYNSGDVFPSEMTPFQPFNKEIVFYTTQSQNYLPKNPYYGLIDTTLYNSYANYDKRKEVFFYENNSHYSFKGTYSTVDIEDLFTGISVDEMYLIRSECYARANKKDDALADLNTLLEKRWETGFFIPFTATTSQEALNLILIERRKELLMRGLRWIDIKRLNKEGANINLKRVVDQTFTLAPNDKRFALPLPDDIIEITGIPQN